MPLFRRPDGDLVKGESPVRKILPYLLPRRNDAVVYHEGIYDIGKTRAFLRAFNRKHETRQPATLFHYFIWCCAQALAERPGMNRFISGSRIYQRKGMFISFAAKKEISEEGALVSIKLPFEKGEPFADCCQRIVTSIELGRGPGKKAVDKELALAFALPGWLLTFVMGAMRWLDRLNLLPGFVIEGDPMYTSLFVANLGSVGLDRAFHHLFEYGTASMFAVLGAPRKQLVPGRDGTAVVKDVLEVRWTLDERINDGLYAGRGLALMRKMFENPDTAAIDALTPPGPNGNGAVTHPEP